MAERSKLRNRLLSVGAIGASALVLPGCGSNRNVIKDCPLDYHTADQVLDQGAVVEAFSRASSELESTSLQPKPNQNIEGLVVAEDELTYYDDNLTKQSKIDQLGELVCRKESDGKFYLSPDAENAIGVLHNATIVVNLAGAVKTKE